MKTQLESFKIKSARILATVFLCMLPVMLSAASKLPDWLSSSMEASIADDDADAVILEHDHRETIQSRARISLHTRFAIKINDRNAREWGIANIPIEGSKRSLKLFKAWLILPNGRVETFAKKDLVFVADRLDDLYSESKRCVLDRSTSIRPGTVFAFEYIINRELHFLNTFWAFQSVFPTIRSRIELDLPDNWSAEPFFFNGDPIPAGRSENILYWEARNLPGIKEETNQPPLGQLLFQMALNLKAPVKDVETYHFKGYSSWSDIARYTAEMHRESQSNLDPSIQEKALELTRDKDTRWEKIEAIAAFAQSLNYVSTSMDLEKGGGHKPRHPNEVFSRHWGDCKDMTALTRALLAGVGIDSIPVLARIGEDDFIPEKWPSPLLFNHCVVGIPLDTAPESVSILQETQLGPVLIFDPTQRYTPVGQFPVSLMGTRILLGKEGIRQLEEIPPPGPQYNHVERNLEASLLENGDLEATITEVAKGGMADYLRSRVLTSSEEELNEFFRNWINSGTRMAEVQEIDYNDNWNRNEFTVTVKFRAIRFAKSVGTGYFAFQPVFLTQLNWVPPVMDDRSTDYVTEAWSLSESLKFILPESLHLENLTETAQVLGRYGNYRISASRADDGFSIDREFEVFHQSVRPENYPQLVEYFEDVSRIDTAQVVVNRMPQKTDK